METHDITAEDILELIIARTAKCETADEVLSEMKRILGSLKSIRFERLERELSLM